MSNNKNITEVWLLSVPLENDYKHTLYFDTKEAQESYFKSRVVYKFTDFSYQRKEQFIRVPSQDSRGLVSSFDSMLSGGINYVMFKNKAYSNKWIYSFINDIKYVDEGRTDISIETDCIQTWLFDYTVKASFVEREHVSNDTVGNHTFPEGLETGEYICNGHTVDEQLNSVLSDLTYVLSSTLSNEKTGDKFEASGGGVYNGIYSGLTYYRYDSKDELNELLKQYAGAGQSDGVNGIFMCPKAFVNSYTGHKINFSTETKNYDLKIGKNLSLNGYKPKNNKMLCYPFQYLLASNNNGGSAVYRLEDFSNGDYATFTVKGALTPGCSIRMTPTNYKNDTTYDEESLNLGKYPICNWTTDMYTNWMVQNASSISTSMQQTTYSAGAGVVTSLLTGGLSGVASGVNSAVNGYFGIKQIMNEIEKQSLVPPQANGNVNCGDVITSSSRNSFHFYEMSIKKEYAMKIDRYFNMFGYQVNQIKKPNKCHRSKYWFTKTIDVNIDGSIPNNDMQIIKNCYNNGITFWRNASEIQNYEVTNDIQITENSITDLGV